MTIINKLLRDDYSLKQAESLQIKYHNVIKKDNKKEPIASDIDDINTIAGVDLSYYNIEGNEYGMACAVLWNPEQEKIEITCFSHDIVKFPYKPGFLGFRECKLLANAIFKLPEKPDLIMCDGHGKIHPRRFGEAVHLGIALNLPTIGIAKNPFVGFSNLNIIEKTKGNKKPIWAKDPNITNESLNELLGYEICLVNDLKPVFISEGYKTTLDFAKDICLLTSKDHRQPQPLFMADYLSRKKVREINSN